MLVILVAMVAAAVYRAFVAPPASKGLSEKEVEVGNGADEENPSQRTVSVEG